MLITLNERDALSHTVDALKKLMDNNLNIAITGQIYTGKTWLFNQLVSDLQNRNESYIVSDFGSLNKHGVDFPVYLCLDHSPLPEALSIIRNVRRLYCGISLLATFYNSPEDGFDVVVELRIAPQSHLKSFLKSASPTA